MDIACLGDSLDISWGDYIGQFTLYTHTRGQVKKMRFDILAQLSDANPEHVEEEQEHFLYAKENFVSGHSKLLIENWHPKCSIEDVLR